MFDFYNGKKVFITGHTGFKGSWLCRMLSAAGAEVTGYALEPPTTPSLFCLAGMDKDIRSFVGEICDYNKLKKVILTLIKNRKDRNSRGINL